MNVLNGKRALVCGSSQGIGFACAQEIAKLGAEVTLFARNEGSLAEATGRLNTDAGQTHGFICADFTDAPSVRDAAASFIEKTGPIQILVNNTGGPAAGPLADATADQLIEGFSKHVLCNQYLVQTLVAGMKSSGYGRIINIISTSVFLPIAGLGVSNTTRGAVANWGRTLARELAPFGITVNNILPGFTGTARLQHLFDDKAKRLNMSAAEVKKQVE